MNSIFEQQSKLERQALHFMKESVFIENPDEFPGYFRLCNLTAKHRRTEFENYKKDLKIFKALFATNNDSLKIALWNCTIIRGKPFKKDFTADEYAFLMRLLDARENRIEVVNVNKPIVTERLILRAIETSDKKLFAYHFKNDGDFFMYTGYEPNAKRIKEYSERRSSLFFTIEVKESHEIIGCAGLILEKESAMCWMDYYIFKQYRNKGYCKEAVTALVGEALNNKLYVPSKESVQKYVYKRKVLKLNAVRAWVSSINIPSLKTIQSCGLVHEATMHNMFYKIGFGWVDKEIYYLTKEKIEFNYERDCKR